MKWRGRRTSQNIDDDRGARGETRGGGEGGQESVLGAVVIVVVGLFRGADLATMLASGGTGFSLP